MNKPTKTTAPTLTVQPLKPQQLDAVVGGGTNPLYQGRSGNNPLHKA
jgi:hypothetical protein